MISVVIPTMWLADGFMKSLVSYLCHPMIDKIIIIDNNRKLRPTHPVLSDPKIELVSYGKNIYVNPAWNEGALRATAPILGILNDDIYVADDVFDMVAKFDLPAKSIIGVNLRGYQNNYVIDDFIDTKEEIVRLNYEPTEAIGSQAWAFGICMFMHTKDYTPIPGLYQVWYGDDYLAQHANAVYAINSNKIKGKISETLTKFNDPDSDVSKRIELDSKNLIRFNHFKNSKSWDLPHNMISMYERQRVERARPNVFAAEYELAKNTPSDINENLHILYELAQECESVVEMGVRTGVSTRAFLNTNVSLLSMDLFLDPGVSALFEKARDHGREAYYVKADVRNIELKLEPDLLFIDTLHTYGQLRHELALHGNKAKKYLVFHDTHTFGLAGEGLQNDKGLLPAIIEFMIENPHWVFHIHKTNNNGLTVLKRTKP